MCRVRRRLDAELDAAMAEELAPLGAEEKAATPGVSQQ